MQGVSDKTQSVTVAKKHCTVGAALMRCLQHENVDVELQHKPYVTLERLLCGAYPSLCFLPGDFTLAPEPVHPRLSELLAGQTRLGKHDRKRREEKKKHPSSFLTAFFYYNHPLLCFVWGWGDWWKKQQVLLEYKEYARKSMYLLNSVTLITIRRANRNCSVLTAELSHLVFFFV